ncbi:unnamed protein product, partial [Laminaria digitata]
HTLSRPTFVHFAREPFPAHVDIRRLSIDSVNGGGGGGGGIGGGGGVRGGGGVDSGGGGGSSGEGVDYPERVRHYLGRLRALQRPKVNRLFHGSAMDAKCLRADPIMRRVLVGWGGGEYLGLDWDSHGHWNEPFSFIQITDPQLGIVEATTPTGGAVWEVECERLSRVVSIVNRLRPKFLLVTGDMTHASPGHEFYEGQVTAARKILAKVSETIPVLYCPGNHDLGNALGSKDDESAYVQRFGADYYSFWWGGVRGLVLNTSLWTSPTANPVR